MPPSTGPTQLQDRPHAQESQPLTCPCSPSLRFSVALPSAGAAGGRTALPAWGSRAFLLRRPRCVCSFCSKRDREAFPALAPDPGERPRSGAHRGTGLSSPQIPRGQPSHGNLNWSPPAPARFIPEVLPGEGRERERVLPLDPPGVTVNTKTVHASCLGPSPNSSL